MYFSEWKLEEDKSYYQTIASFKELSSPFFKVRVIPVELNNYYLIVIRDYKTGEIFSNTTRIGMVKSDEGNITNLNQAKAHAEALAQSCMRVLTSS